MPVLPAQANAVHSPNTPGVNVPIVPFSLMPATGGNGALTYQVAGLPNGITFSQLGPDGAVGGGDDLQISGTPTAVTDGAETVTVIVTDTDTAITGGGANDVDTTTFTFTVTDVPATPAAPVVVATRNTSGSLDVSWTAPADNNSAIIDYEVQHREMGAATWMHTTNLGTSTSTTFSRLTDGTTYQFQVRARSAVGWSAYSAITTGTPMASGALPDAPSAPTVTAGSARGSLDVSWVAPADNGSTISGYDVQYWMDGQDRRQRDDVAGTTATLAGLGDNMSYMVRVRAVSNNGDSLWSEPGTGITAAAPVLPDLKGQITAMKLTGGVTSKNIGGATRVHVTEGASDVKLEVTVQWTHEEICRWTFGWTCSTCPGSR